MLFETSSDMRIMKCTVKSNVVVYRVWYM